MSSFGGMIDYLKITLRNFTGNFDNCCYKGDGVHEQTGKTYKNYILPNNSRPSKQHRMDIAWQVESNTVTIERSVRKWANHRNTLADLTSKSFERTMKKLADKLSISFEELCCAGFTDCEIGLNIKTAIPGYQITPMAIKYGRLKQRNEVGDKSKTVYFESVNKTKKLKLYDKVVEVADNARGGAANKAIMRRVSEKLTDIGYHQLRIEYTLPNKKAFTQHGLGHIKTIGDLITHYSDLYEFWSRETNEIVLFNNKAASIDREKISSTELRIMDNLKRYGFAKAVEVEASEINRNAPSATVMLSRVQRKILTVIEKHYRNGYCTQTLRLDASRHLWSQYAKYKVDIPLGACLQALWEVKTGKSGSH